MKNIILILTSILFLTGFKGKKVDSYLQDRGGVRYENLGLGIAAYDKNITPLFVFSALATATLRYGYYSRTAFIMPTLNS